MRIRKLLALGICGVMALSLGACGSGGDNGGQGESPADS